MKKIEKAVEKVAAKSRLSPCEAPARTRSNCCHHQDSPGVLLEAPEVPPRIPMASPDFEQLLTSAEKLNDQNYRGLVYRAYPNEPTCACPQITSGKAKKKKKKKKQQQQQQQEQQQQSGCRSGCTNHCCSSVRATALRKDPANDLEAHFMPTHCAPSTKNDEVYNGGGGCCSGVAKARLRGGGSDELVPGFFNADADYSWYNSKFMMPSRMEGGGGGETYPSVGCGKTPGRLRNNSFSSQQNFFKFDTVSPQYLAANKCKLRHVEDSSNKCSCTDKDQLDAMMRKKGQAVCTKKPCMGTDCLIKAFNDAQSFVDSLGKVPGLAGLGIIESPYFGNQQESREVKRADSKAMSVIKHIEAPTHLCNLQNFENTGKSSYSNAVPVAFNATGPRKTVVQEGISYPDPSTHASLKSKKKDEKIEKPKETESSPAPAQIFEDTPCGEPQCKSRPKRVTTEETTAETAEKSAAVHEKKLQPQKSLASKAPRPKSSSGPSGGNKSKPTQFVYSFGNNYPTNVYGHKKCNNLRARVPAHMGWLWNKTDTIANLKPRAGWRPGAISSTLRDMLREAKAGFQETKRPMSAPSRSKKGKADKTMSFTNVKKSTCAAEEQPEEEIEFPPTLHIHRKDGVYYVTMYPIRQETNEVPRIDEPINPLQFKIVKSKGSLATSSTASDMEIEFSPPAAVNRLKKKPNVIHVETQVQQQQILDSFKKISDASKGGKGGKGGKKDKGKKK